MNTILELPVMTEAEVRALRDRVFGQASMDLNWSRCRESWMAAEGLQWLLDHEPKHPL